MIKSLYLKNFALFKETHINFQLGLNIVTGETGSGKSLLLKSLKFLSGERFLKDYIRQNTDRCVLEIEFDNKGDSNTIRRVFHSGGKSRSFLNDEPISIEKLKQLSQTFLDYHGQHENQKLFKPTEQLHILDQFAGHTLKVEKLNEVYNSIFGISKEIQKIKSLKQQFFREQEIIEFQLNEISQVEFNLEEDIELTRRLKKITNQSEINTKLELSTKSLKFDVLENFNKIRQNFDYIVSFDNDFSEIANRFDSLICEIEDLSFEMEKHSSAEIPNKLEIQRMNEKLSILEMLKRKYGGSLEAVLVYQNEILKKINYDSTLNQKLKDLEIKKSKLEIRYKKLAKIITKNRLSVLRKIIPEIESNLCKLGMENTKFRIDIDEQNLNDIYPYGYEKCEFKIASNKSDDVKSMNKIASGGELSRIQLALKMLNLNKTLKDTIVFDEIDTGISGKIADMTGIVMKKIAKNQQVLCITHLPQIAGKGDAHFVPKKIIYKNETIIKVHELTVNEKVEEIASLMSGKKITQSSKERALEILKVQ